MSDSIIERLRLGNGTSPDHNLLLEAAAKIEQLYWERQDFKEAYRKQSEQFMRETEQLRNMNEALLKRLAERHSLEPVSFIMDKAMLQPSQEENGK